MILASHWQRWQINVPGNSRWNSRCYWTMKFIFTNQTFLWLCLDLSGPVEPSWSYSTLDSTKCVYVSWGDEWELKWVHFWLIRPPNRDLSFISRPSSPENPHPTRASNHYLPWPDHQQTHYSSNHHLFCLTVGQDSYLYNGEHSGKEWKYVFGKNEVRWRDYGWVSVPNLRRANDAWGDILEPVEVCWQISE